MTLYSHLSKSSCIDIYQFPATTHDSLFLPQRLEYLCLLISKGHRSKRAGRFKRDLFTKQKSEYGPDTHHRTGRYDPYVSDPRLERTRTAITFPGKEEKSRDSQREREDKKIIKINK